MIKNLITAPLRSTPITGASSLLRRLLPLCRSSILSILLSLQLDIFSYHPGDRFSCSRQSPVLSSRCLYAGCRSNNNQVALLLVPGTILDLSFDTVLPFRR